MAQSVALAEEGDWMVLKITDRKKNDYKIMNCQVVSVCRDQSYQAF